MRYLIRLFFLLVLIYTSCSSRQDELFSLFKHETFSKLNSKGETRILILPVEGCLGCIEKATVFVKDNFGNPAIKVVLVAADSKTAKNYLAKNNMALNDEIKSMLNERLVEFDLISGFPQLLSFENGLLQEKLELTAFNIDFILEDMSKEFAP